jgi:large subunit ribosomal protein L4
MIQLFNNLKLDNRNILLVTNDMNENVLLSARNLQYVDVMRVSDLATYNIMRAKSLVFVESSVQGLNEMFNLNEE